MAVVVLVLWIATVAAGLTLLRSGGAGRREPVVPAESLAGVPVRVGAAPLTAAGKPPPIEHPHAAKADNVRTAMEFSHPALAITGIACWMMFAFVHYRPLAWIAFVILTVTLLLGLTWLAYNRRAAQKDQTTAWSFSPRLVWIHGLIAASSLMLTVLTAVIASRG